jgi:hypothetical protein
MLQLPDTGFRYSAREHNSDLDVVCDWIEASVLFTADRVTTSDVLDALIEEQVYEDEDFANAFIDDAFQVIQRRISRIGPKPALRVSRNALERAVNWTDAPAHSYCLAVALRHRYASWKDSFPGTYVEQGDLFEKLASEALQGLGWSVVRIGWSGVKAQKKFAEAVEGIADYLNEGFHGDEIPDEVKDAGVDLVCVRKFLDELGGHPSYLVQCGSGENWQTKLGSPSLESWRDMIRFTAPPARALAIPFAFARKDEFRAKRLSNGGLLLDRYRLLSAAGHSPKWLSTGLAKELVSWLRPAIKAIPTLD